MNVLKMFSVSLNMFQKTSLFNIGKILRVSYILQCITPEKQITTKYEILAKQVKLVANRTGD